MGDVLMINRWRRLAVRRWGPRDGRPVFLLHGMPGSRLSARPTDAELGELGVSLITYDRPGYGLSDPHPGRSVADAADDVRAIADQWGLDSFAVLGRSGGGPHALACAALLPERVTRVASLVGLAPFDAEGLDWLDGMADLNQRQFHAALKGPRQLAQHLYPQVVALRASPDHLVQRLVAEATDDDRTVLSDPAHRASLVSSMAEAVTRTIDGWASDSLAFTRPWGFDPGWITAPTLLWHGAWDVFVPVTHAYWLADRIQGATLLLHRGLSHLDASDVQVDAVRWLVHGTLPEESA